MPSHEMMDRYALPILGLSRQATGRLLAIARECKWDVAGILERADIEAKADGSPMILERDIELAYVALTKGETGEQSEPATTEHAPGATGGDDGERNPAPQGDHGSATGDGTGVQ